MPLTTDEIKALAPLKINIKFSNGTIREGIVQGQQKVRGDREIEFAQVMIQLYGTWANVGQWTWDAVTRCYNESKPLIY